MRNSTNKMVSVIVPVYNRHTLFLKTLRSLIRQDITNFKLEIIVIDDCSTPSVSKFLTKRYPESLKKIKIIRNKKNMGPALSRNKGISVSKGNYVSFLDSDDIYKPDFVEELTSKINFNKSEAAISYMTPLFTGKHSLLNIFFYTSLSLSRLFCFTYMYFFKKSKLDDSFFYMTRLSGMIFTKKSISNISFSEKYKSAEDWQFVLKCIIKNNITIKILPTFLVDFRYHKNSETLGRSGYWNYYYDLINETPIRMRKKMGIKLFKLYTDFSALKDTWQKNL